MIAFISRYYHGTRIVVGSYVELDRCSQILNCKAMINSKMSYLILTLILCLNIMMKVRNLVNLKVKINYSYQ